MLFADQDRGRWDAEAIAEGATLAAVALRRGRGPYALQAAIAAEHATSPSAAAIDWARIADLYAELGHLDRSPAIELNRAVAVAEIDGPAAALAIVDALLERDDGGALARASLQPHLVRADLLERLGQLDDAATAYRLALALARTEPERRLLAARLGAL